MVRVQSPAGLGGAPNRPTRSSNFLREGIVTERKNQVRRASRLVMITASACLAAVLSAGGALAQKRALKGPRVVLYTFGGTQLETTRELVIKPFEQETGAKVVVDDSCCQRLQAAMEAGQFI